MDPDDIERIAYPSSDQMYTVVNRATKPSERAPRKHMKHNSSSPDVMERPGSSNADRRQDGGGASKHHSSSNISVAKGSRGPAPR